MLSHRPPRAVLDEPRHNPRHVTIPQHRHDDKMAHMRPDANDTLLVLADCLVHFTRQKRTEIGTVAPPCPRGEKCNARACTVCGEPKERTVENFKPKYGGKRLDNICRECVNARDRASHARRKAA